MLSKHDGALIRQSGPEVLKIEAWGKNGLRIRATALAALDESRDWALLPKGPERAEITVEGESALVRNGDIAARLSPSGRISFLNKAGEVILEERWRNRDVPGATYNSTNVSAREFRPAVGGTYRLAYRFEASEGEKLFGMGQYQDGCLELKGCVLELAQRNSQASVPFLLSSRGYGLLWNNPAIGRASLGKNFTEFMAERSPQLDIWVTAGESPAAIEESYASVTGTVPMMPEFAMGFWQCKLRYKTQDELMSVAREYKRRGLPISVIVSDFFHWPMQGDWKFDSRYWPDPEGMVKELASMGIELMVSVWPTVDKRSENFQEMSERGLLVRSERGINTTMDFMGDCVFFDATNPASREFIWAKAKKNYYDKGIKIFWLDEAEPEYSVYDYDNYRYHSGSVMETGNFYPVGYAQAFYEGMVKEGRSDAINLLRCAWAGSQRYGALVWSGDIDTTFESFRAQFAAGLNMGLAGIPWWTTDIGGFGGGDPDDSAYRELLVRWFQYGTFCPVFRLHGFRIDKSPEFDLVHAPGSTSEDVFSGGPNEVWSYGEEAYGILKDCLFARERMRPYIKKIMKEAHEKGTPVMRPLFYDFPADKAAWDCADQYMFGPDLLVAPVLHAGERKRGVYLPAGASWKELSTGNTFKGGSSVECDAPLAVIPLFVREGATIQIFE